mgnify:CR=1 FL=1|jgi:uncharacterized protein HemY
MDEKTCAFMRLAKALQANAEKEAEAVKGYTEQLEAILAAQELADEEDRDFFLSKLYEATQEKISDELNHNQSLLNEYVEFTGIPVAEE